MSASAPASERIIVNADDLGADSSVNRAIIRSFEQGVINSASIMPTMPGFHEACDLVEAAKLHACIGIHLNLSQGNSLTARIRDISRLCGPDGFRTRVRAFRLNASEAAAIEHELEAQIRTVVARLPRPSHLDSHHHVHTEWAVGAIVLRLARRYGIPCIRISRNIGPPAGMAKSLYKYIYNGRLKRAALARSRYFGSAADVAPLLRHLDGIVEIGVHPRLNEHGVICDFETGPAMAQQHAALGLPKLHLP